MNSQHRLLFAHQDLCYRIYTKKSHRWCRSRLHSTQLTRKYEKKSSN